MSYTPVNISIAEVKHFDTPAAIIAERNEIFPDFYAAREEAERPIDEPIFTAMMAAIKADMYTAHWDYLNKPGISDKVNAWVSSEPGRNASQLWVLLKPKGTSGVRGRDLAAGFEGTAVGVYQYDKLFTLNSEGQTEIDRFANERVHPLVTSSVLSDFATYEAQYHIVSWGDVKMPDPEYRQPRQYASWMKSAFTTGNRDRSSSDNENARILSLLSMGDAREQAQRAVSTGLDSASTEAMTALSSHVPTAADTAGTNSRQTDKREEYSSGDTSNESDSRSS